MNSLIGYVKNEGFVCSPSVSIVEPVISSNSLTVCLTARFSISCNSSTVNKSLSYWIWALTNASGRGIEPINSLGIEIYKEIFYLDKEKYMKLLFTHRRWVADVMAIPDNNEFESRRVHFYIFIWN